MLMKKLFLFICVSLLLTVNLSAQRLNSVSLSSIHIGEMPLYYAVPSEAQKAFGRAIKVETQSVPQNGPYDGIYPFATADPYGALYGFYPYGGFYGYNDAYPYWGTYSGPWGVSVLYTYIMIYPHMVLYFNQGSTGAPQYLANANIYSSDYTLHINTSHRVSVGDSLSVLESLFPISCATAISRHGGKYPSTFKVIVKASTGEGRTEENARMVFVINEDKKIAAIQISLY